VTNKEKRPKPKPKEPRLARCGVCKTTTPSHENLPHFVSHPKEPEDGYYCGCAAEGYDDYE